jgi:hypothetical protein
MCVYAILRASAFVFVFYFFVRFILSINIIAYNKLKKNNDMAKYFILNESRNNIGFLLLVVCIYIENKNISRRNSSFAYVYTHLAY